MRNLLFAFLLSASSVAYAGPSDLELRMEVAEAKYQKAQDAGFAWRANRVTLEKARAAFNNGDEQAATALIEEAIKLADASLAQAAREAAEWNTRFPFAGS